MAAGKERKGDYYEMDNINIPYRTQEERIMDIPTHNSNKLTYQQVMFIDNYIIHRNAKEAYKQAYPDCNPEKASAGASRLMRNKNVQAEIQRRTEELKRQTVRDANAIMTLLTQIARGEVLDQFGLDASLKDRMAALKELKSISIDMPAKDEKNQTDNNISIKLIRD